METAIATRVSEAERRLLESAYKLFNRRDIDGVLRLMHEDVTWPNGMEGGREIGHKAVRAYWTRQWKVVDPHVEPLSFTKDGEQRIVVDVRQVVKDMGGAELLNQRIDHVYTIEDGLISKMEVELAAVMDDSQAD